MVKIEDMANDYREFLDKVEKLNEEHNEQIRELVRKFNGKYYDTLIRKDFKTYGNIGIRFFGVNSNTSFEMFEILDVGMNVGERYPFMYPDLLRTFEVVDKSVLSDNSLDVNGITIEDLKTYFETMEYPIKQVVGTYANYLKFEFELQSGDLILVISECGTKARANKFSTLYNNLKKIGFNKKVIKEIKYNNYFEKNCKVHHISCNKGVKSISIMYNYKDEDCTKKIEFNNEI